MGLKSILKMSKKLRLSVIMREAISIAEANGGALVLHDGHPGFIGRDCDPGKDRWFTVGDPDRWIAYQTLEPLVRAGVFEHFDCSGVKSAVRLVSPDFATL